MNLASHFSNFTDFRHLQIPNAWTKYYEILPAHTKTPHNTTHKIARLYFEFKYHFSTLQKKFRLLLNKGVHSQLPWYDHPIFVWDKSHWGLVTSCIVINLGIGWVNGLLPDVMSHYLNQCLRTVTTWLHCHWKYHWEWNVFLVVSASKLSCYCIHSWNTHVRQTFFPFWVAANIKSKAIIVSNAQAHLKPTIYMLCDSNANHPF